MIEVLAAAGLQAGSTMAAADAAKDQAREAERISRLKAGQFYKKAEQIQSTGRREAAEIKRQGKLLTEEARAGIVAGGGVSEDAGQIIDDLEEVTDYNALITIRQAELEAEDTRQSARHVIQGGMAESKAYRDQAKATMLKGATSMFGTFSDYFADLPEKEET